MHYLKVDHVQRVGLDLPVCTMFAYILLNLVLYRSQHPQTGRAWFCEPESPPFLIHPAPEPADLMEQVVLG